MSRLEIKFTDMRLISTKQEAYGDRSVYKVDAETMKRADEVFVMQRLNYSTQPQIVQRQADGTGRLEVFWSIGD